VIPVVTPEEMGEIDREAPEPVEVLIGRAGAAVARSAVEVLGGTYGRRVVVIAGKGNNGNDGRSAAERLVRRGVRVEVIAPSADAVVAPCDLVIDAAYGTGFRGTYVWPDLPPGAAVLAVDIPSGVDGLTGQTAGQVPQARRTVTFAALKPGLLLEPGATLAGEIVVADIGLDVSAARASLVERDDVAAWLRPRPVNTNKWRAAVWVVAGSPGMTGAAALVSRAALRSGAGYVRQSTPGLAAASADPVEAVQVDLAGSGWASAVLGELDRFAALVIGNGLGTTPATQAEIREVVAAAGGLPVVVDADGLTALAAAPVKLSPNVVLTPHDGEFARLAGNPPGPDRLAAAADLARQLGCVVLLKGGPTVVAAPDGGTLVVATGDSRLATAGTGDVLAGVIGALAARGLDPFHAAAAGAFLHGEAGALGWRDGLVAGDLPRLLPEVIERLAHRPG
jgi:ADP-dependent NAD(P)H-hydrate dehydratase / NAD(P)H-hydrate epimerase